MTSILAMESIQIKCAADYHSIKTDSKVAVSFLIVNVHACH